MQDDSLCCAQLGSEIASTVNSNLHPQPDSYRGREQEGRTNGQLILLLCAQPNLYICADPYLEFV